MARINKGILGGVSGKVGNVVGGSWKGRDYLRSLPAGGNQTNSEMQKAQRAKFKTLIAFLRPMTPLIRVGFKPEAEKITAFNAAVKYNYHHALDGDQENGFFVEYSLALLSKGELPSVSSGQAVAQADYKLALSWLNNAGYAGAQATDILFVAAYNPTKENAVINMNVAQRGQENAELLLPVEYLGDEVQVFAGFLAESVLQGTATRATVANSSYLGAITVQ
jgi:hypothetical protein